MEITPGVHHVPVDVPRYHGAPFSPNVFFVVDAGEAVMIDAGFPDRDSIEIRLRYLANELGGARLKYVVLTHFHFDHSSGAHIYRERTGAQIVLNKHDVQPLLDPGNAPQDLPEDEGSEEQRRYREEARRSKPDIEAEDGQVLRVGRRLLRLLHVPGHSPGSQCLFLEDEGVLFTGDCVLGQGTTAISPPPYGDMLAYVESLRKMQRLNAALLCPGHGPLVKEPNRKLQELIDHRAARDQQVLELIGQGKNSVSQMLRLIYPEISPRLRRAARDQILAHLHKLQREGKLTFHQENGEVIATLV